MNNKDIQTLIERERNEAYHKEISCLSITDEEYQGYRDGYDKGIDKGIEIALSLFKWRKVSEELPKETGRYLCLMDDNPQNAVICFFNMERKQWSAYGVIEWMPIPQID